jgi:hypothetical protein
MLGITKSGDRQFNFKMQLNCESEMTLHSTIDSAYLEAKKPV